MGRHGSAARRSLGPGRGPDLARTGPERTYSPSDFAMMLRMTSLVPP